jgi:hypothetical protein
MARRSSESAGAERLSWLLLVLALGASLWLVLGAKQHAAAPVARAQLDLTEAVPDGPALLVTLDLAALGQSALRQLLQAGGDRVVGLQQLCGFEPWLGLRRVVLALPPSDAQSEPDFALIADTTLEPEAVLRCAEAVIRRRGGSPARSRLGGFESVRDAKKPLGEVAIRGDGLFVLSGGAYFRAVIDAASGLRAGDEAARLRSAVHAELRRRLGSSPIAVSGLSGAALTLPGVRAFAVGLSLERDVELRGVVSCVSAPACGDAKRWLAELLGQAAQAPGLASLAELQIAEQGAELTLAGRLPVEQLGPALSQLLAP